MTSSDIITWGLIKDLKETSLKPTDILVTGTEVYFGCQVDRTSVNTLISNIRTIIDNHLKTDSIGDYILSRYTWW